MQTATEREQIPDSCETCKFWERITRGETYPLEHGRGILISEEDVVEDGRCRRFPPQIFSDAVASARARSCYGVPTERQWQTMTSDGMVKGGTKFPITHELEWCGEYQSREDDHATP